MSACTVVARARDIFLHSRSALREAAADGVEEDGARGSGATEPKRTDGDGAALACADACVADDEAEVDADDDSMAETLKPRGSSRSEQPSESR
jgi:hypothetical protein